MKLTIKKWVTIGVSLLLAGTAVYFLIKIQPPISFYITFTWILLIASLLWIGSTLISRFLDKKLPWKEYVTARFFIQLGLTIIYSLFCVNTSYFLLKKLFTNDPPVWEQVLLTNIYGLLLILPTFSIYFGIHFLKAWKKSQLETERLQKEGMRSQLQALRNHLDPHFLFNNLNILSILIDKDQALSKQYLERFAEVYRIILQNEVSELITLKKELDFIKSYLYLIKIRFQDDINVDLNIEAHLKMKMVPPLSIQMLIENCIKHNAITETSPLAINIFTEDDEYLVVKNNLKPKKTGGNGKSSGLENIRNRYRYFTDKNLIIEQSTTHFIIKIPLLEIEEL
ncbi:histidine kinase [Fulvivirgaceae bacterium BMA12]|uniref:Histidine kinase n=1 Tax=Agaribacillus aureus TaxID=3051825 RepID=A0ABT8L4V8_9BACT|nr:histidine kinase [Fulvivirgaceae bacterium BMA12]